MQQKGFLKYLKGTIRYGILFRADDLKQVDVILDGFSDADYANDVDTRRSITGFCFLFGGNLVTWNSECQKSVALSTTEAEYMASCSAARELVWLRRIISELTGKEIKSMLFVDNQAAVRLAKNPEFHKRTKHID